MNHPKPEELSEFLYKEAPPEKHHEIARHIEGCAQCRSLLDSWQATRAELQSWKLPPAGQPQIRWPGLAANASGLWKWAAAAMLMAGIGFGLARATVPGYDVSRLRAEVSSQITDQVTQQLKAELTRFATDQSARQQEYQQAITKAIGHLEAQRLLELASLRQDVETVAVNAQDELDSTRKGLYVLAAAESSPRSAAKH